MSAYAPFEVVTNRIAVRVFLDFRDSLVANPVIVMTMTGFATRKHAI